MFIIIFINTGSTHYLQMVADPWFREKKIHTAYGQATIGKHILLYGLFISCMTRDHVYSLHTFTECMYHYTSIVNKERNVFQKFIKKVSTQHNA